MRVIVCGGRDYDDPVAVRAAVRLLEGVRAASGTGLTVVHGAARGLDSAVAAAAAAAGLDVEPHPARWREHDRDATSPAPCRCPADAPTCRAAGPRRNREMLAAGADLVIAVHPDVRSSSGTLDMATAASAAGVPVIEMSRFAP